MKVEVGDTVWFSDYRGVDSGEVIAILSKSFNSDRVACLKCRDEFKSLEIDSRHMYLTRQDAVLALAMNKQQEAASLLNAAADLFKQAGGMKEDVAVAAE
jgi:hypothetical protein